MYTNDSLAAMTEKSPMVFRPAMQAESMHHALATLAAVFLGVLSGCGGDQLPVVPVTGTVTLDGEPLGGALVEFQPIDSLGSPSYSATDAAGKYDLTFSQTRRGAWVGEHLVRISTRNENERLPEKLPPQYHATSNLKRQVEANGETVLDFDIKLNETTAEPTDSESN